MNRFPQSHTDLPARPAIVLAGLLLTLFARPAWSDEAAKEAAPVPKDTCVLELTLPEGATTSIDGDDRGAKRRMTWSKLKPGAVYQTRLMVTFRSGGSDERVILIEGGRRIRLALPSPNSKMPQIIPQVGHTRVESAQLSPDGQWLLTGGRDGNVILWDAKTGRSICVFKGPGSSVRRVAISNDGRRILATFYYGSRVWDVDSPDKPKFVRDEKYFGELAALSADGRRIAFLGIRSDQGVWDVDTGERISTFPKYSGIANSVVFSPDGRQVLASMWSTVEDVAHNNRNLHDDSAILWDVATGQTVREFEKQRRVGGLPAGGVAFSPDGSQIATGAGDRRVILWKAASGEKLLTLAGHRDQLGAIGIAFSPDGRQLLSHSYREAILWDTSTGKPRHKFRTMMGRVHGVTFLPQGPAAIVSSVSIANGLRDISDTQIVSLVSGKNLFPTVSQQMSPISAVAFNPNGRQIAMTGYINSPIVWNGATGVPQSLLGAGNTLGMMTQFAGFLAPTSTDTVTSGIKGHLRPVNCLAFSADGRQLLTGSYDTTGILWDAETGTQIHKLLGHRGMSSQNREITPMVASTLLKYMISGELNTPQSDKERRADLERYRRWQETRPGTINCVAFSGDGRFAITGGDDEKAIVWRCPTGQKVRQLLIPRAPAEGPDKPAEPRQVHWVALNHDGTLALTATKYSCIAILWDVATGKKIKMLEKNLSSVYALTFSADGQPLALVQPRNDLADRHVSLINVRTDEIVRTLSESTVADLDETVALSADQKRVACSGSLKTTVVVLDFDKRAELRRLEGHDADVKSMAFSPDGQRLLTGSDDGTCRLWNIATGQELARITTLKGENDWLMTTPEGLFDGSAGGREKVMFRVGSGLNVVPVDRFFQDFYYPGLLAAIWRGERPLPKVEMGGSLPPKVTIVAPSDGGVVEQNRATLNVEAVDQGGGVRGPWLVQNGARVLAAGKTEQKGKTIRRAFEVPLVQGENRLEFHAASADGSWESEPAAITLRYEKPLPKPDLYLVSVGVNHYAEKSISLGFAAADAQAMADLFRQRGPSLYRAVHATTLLDEHATAAAILEALRRLSEQTRPQDTVAVFLAGHGAVAGRQYYFLPHEFHRQAKTWDEDVRVQGLSAQRLQETLVAVAALKRVVVFDTGQSGGAIGLVKTARDPFALRGAIERLSRASGAFMIASAAVSDEAQEVPDLKHGVLTYALLAGLHAAPGGPLDNQWIQPKNKDRVADVLDWFGFASAHVPRLTKQYFGQQQELQHSSFGASFPILPVAASAAPAPIASTAASPPISQPIVPSAVRGLGKARLHVVAVGINRYREEAMNLKFARNDVESIVGLFRRRGQRLYREVIATEVLDAQATKEGILGSLDRATQRAAADDALVVFFSGHGRMVGQRYYFIPSDFRRQEGAVEEDVRRQGVPADVLADTVSKSPAQRRILIFDTCASGGALGISRHGQDPFAFRGAIAKLGQRPGVFTIAASAAGQEAQEIDSLGHGVLTYALLAGLRAVPAGGPLEGLNVQPNGPEGTVDVLDWFSFASGHVPRLTKRYLHQVQEVQTTAQGTSFSLLPAWEP